MHYLKKLLLSIFFLSVQTMLHAQERKITGKVSSTEDALPLAGVTVSAKGTKNITSTNNAGMYEISGATGEVLVFTYQGRTAVERTLNATETVVNISMEKSELILNEVVVTALGVTREKKAVGYSVQELKGAELTKTKDLNIVNALSGKVAGVQVTNAGGALGSSSRIVIRGNSSFGENQPLFVVDGVPILNDATTVSGGQGVDYGNGAADIDPNNIESISVLKGANASALYGSRAANGVILITTKKGSGKARLGVDVTSTVMADNVYIIPKLQNSYGQGLYGSEQIWKRDNPNMSYQDYAKAYSYNYGNGRGAGVNDMIDESWGPRLDAGLRLDQFMGQNLPWVSNPGNTKEFYETGITSDNNVSLFASGEKASGRLSVSSLNAKGTLPNTDLKQHTINFSSTLNLSDRLKVQANITYLQRKSDNLVRGQYNNNPVMSVTGWFGRQIDMKLLKDNWKNNDQFGNPYNWQGGVENPFLTMRNTNAMNKHRIFGNLNASYKLTDWLTAKAVVGTDYYSEFRKNITQSRSNLSTRGGKFDQTQIFASETNADFMLFADKQVSSDIRIDAIAGANVRNNKYNSMWLQASQLTVADLYTIGNVRGTVGSSMYNSEKETQSVYASANASYKNYLFLGITGRNDWSSALPAANRSYFYPSASLGFVATDAFDISSSVLSYGKLRLGWAQVGNDTGPYNTMATYAPGGTAWNGVALYSYARQIPPINLKPEITTSFEVGADLRFLSNRINLDVTYYKTSTNNQIMAVNIPKPTGFGSMLINAGEIQNQGIELQLGASIIKNKDAFNWDVMLNWSKNTSKVVELYPGITSYNLGPSNNVTIQAIPGRPFGEIKGGAYMRDSKGNIVVNSSGIPNVVSNQVIGNILPDWTGGISNSFSYKNFNLSVLLDMRMGGDIFSFTTWHNLANGTLQKTVDNNVRENGLIVPGVFDDGRPNDVRVTAEDYYRGGYIWSLHENSMIDASYVKLREVALSYRIPVKKIKFLNNASVSLVGRNLALLYTHKSNFANIDPETGLGVGNNGLGIEMFQIPSSRSMGVKLQLGF